jgi:hypothetical protein
MCFRPTGKHYGNLRLSDFYPSIFSPNI